MTKCRFNLCTTTKNPSKSSSGAPPQGTTGTHRIIENYAGGAAVESRADSAAQFIAEMIDVPVSDMNLLFAAMPAHDRQDLTRMAEGLEQARRRHND